jgi:hypothetical protein
MGEFQWDLRDDPKPGKPLGSLVSRIFFWWCLVPEMDAKILGPGESPSFGYALVFYVEGEA